MKGKTQMDTLYIVAGLIILISPEIGAVINAIYKEG